MKKLDKDEKQVVKHLKHDIKDAKKGMKDDKSLMGKLKQKEKK